ncbi:MAG: anthranilate phosphoribosyltransferase [Desulfobacterales bacterium]|nr:anthranilate phosphoribosyltransferase [Desulfobacterales bacterium]
MEFTQGLKQIISGRDLSREEMAAMVTDIFSGTVPQSCIGAFMAGLAAKGETHEELAGAAAAMRRKAVRIQSLNPVTIDTCGTGGDASGSFNISTTTAFVLAGAGVTVAKHGNRSISSQCGSADVLEALGVNLDVEPEIVEEAVNDLGIGFMFAPRFHGAMGHAAQARKECGIRSIFNMLGPLTNPAAASCQVLGVFAPELTEMFALTLDQLGVKRAFVVHGHDGMDEITTTDLTRVSELNQGQIKTYDLDPLEFFDALADPKELQGGDAQTNAGMIKAILAGESGPRRDIILINSAAGLVAAGRADTIKAGIAQAKTAIDSGAAMEKLTALVEFTQENGK